MNIQKQTVAIRPPAVGNTLHYSTSGLVMAAIMLVSMPASAESPADARPTMTQSSNLSVSDGRGLQTSAMRDNMPVGMYKASKMIGMEVKDRTGNSIGEIKDMALEPGQDRIRYAVLSFGGVMGVWDKLFAVPLHAFEQGTTDKVLVLNVSKTQLEEIKGFDDDYWPTSVAAYWSGAQEGASAQNSQTTAPGVIIKATEYLEREVKNLAGDDLGEIEDLAVELSSSRIKYVVIEHGGLLGIGEKLVAVPASTLSFSKDDDKIFLNATEDELDNARGFSDGYWPLAANSIADIQYPPTDQQNSTTRNAHREHGSSQQHFSTLDADKNGYLSKSEVNREAALEQQYKALDENRDGKLDRVEFSRFGMKTDRNRMRPMQNMNKEQGNS